MTTFTIGQRVRSTVPEAERASLVDFLVYALENHQPSTHCFSRQDVLNVKNSPVEGDTGTIVSIDDDDDGECFLVEWDREIGPATGERTKPNHWFVSSDAIAPIGEEVKEAA